MRDFQGRVAVVTGAASGIGRALGVRFAEAGMNVVLADVQRDALEATAAQLREHGGEVRAVVTDVTQADDLLALAEATEDAFGAAHVVCHNAGVFAAGLSWEAPLTDYAWVLDVNVWGVIHGIRAFTPRLLSHGEPAHQVITASMAGVTTSPFVAPYTLSKHAAVALAETLYLELRAKQSAIGVSVLCPEVVATRIGDSERNRPEHQKRDGPTHAERDLVEDALRASTVGGLAPEAIAARTFEAIEEDRFYVFPPDGDPWRLACERRLDDIRHVRNPNYEPPVSS
ncbi:MAG: SDR family NAD(P)-dependent oxidoreductase [Myxococcota bacterium]